MRYLYEYLKKDLGRKMVFLGGPRQCGKTTLAEAVMGAFSYARLFNWDDDIHRREILARRWSSENELLIFDELNN